METVRNNEVRRARLSMADWVDAAFDSLEADGVGAVAVEPIAARLGVTKGSFYSHFANRDELLAAALERWRDHEIGKLDGEIDAGADPRVQLGQLFDLLFGRRRDGRIFAAVCAAGEDSRVGPVVRDVSNRRVRVLRDLYVAAGLDRAAAGHRAMLTYTSYVGHWRINAGPTRARPAEFSRYVAHLKDTLIPARQEDR